MNINRMAFSATLHCLIGCSIGEVTGLIIGTSLGLSNGLTVAISVVLAFIFGFWLSLRTLLRAGVVFGAAFSTVFAADTLSIATMEIFDNLVMIVMPGAMNAGLANLVFWLTMPLSLLAGFVAAFPINRYLLTKGKGHALTMKYHDHTGNHNQH